MWRNYVPNTFLRRTPNKVLKEYFARKDLLKDIKIDTSIDTPSLLWM